MTLGRVEHIVACCSILVVDSLGAAAVNGIKMAVAAVEWWVGSAVAVVVVALLRIVDVDVDVDVAGGLEDRLAWSSKLLALWRTRHGLLGLVNRESGIGFCRILRERAKKPGRRSEREPYPCRWYVDAGLQRAHGRDEHICTLHTFHALDSSSCHESELDQR